MTNRWKLAAAGAAGAAVAAVAVLALSDRGSEPAGAAVPVTSAPPSKPPGGEPATDRSAARTITVSGHGTVSVVPDTADLMAGVQAQAATASEALDTVGTKSQALIDALKGQGVAQDDISTSGLGLWPTYADGSQRVTGYQASTSVTATVHDVATVGDVVDTLKSLVGDQLTLNGISFTYKDPEAVMADARTAAVANARVRAEQYAKAAGVELGGVLRIVESSVSEPVMYREMAGAPMPAAADSKVAVGPGTQDLAADVSIVFDVR